MGVVVVLWVGGDLLDIVTSDRSGPGGGDSPGRQSPPAGAPPGESPPREGTDDGDQTPPGGQPHDPSDFDHG